MMDVHIAESPVLEDPAMSLRALLCFLKDLRTGLEEYAGMAIDHLEEGDAWHFGIGSPKYCGTCTLSAWIHDLEEVLNGKRQESV